MIKKGYQPIAVIEIDNGDSIMVGRNKRNFYISLNKKTEYFQIGRNFKLEDLDNGKILEFLHKITKGITEDQMSIMFI